MTVYGSEYKSAASCAVNLMHQAFFAFLETVVNEGPFLQSELLCPSMPRVARDCGSSALMFLQAWTGNAMRGWRSRLLKPLLQGGRRECLQQHLGRPYLSVQLDLRH